jgi:hypothetical protein
MSQRHRSEEAVVPPKHELRSKAHGERHRINGELHAVAVKVSGGYAPDEVHEPGPAWVPSHHHDAGKAKAGAVRTGQRHWKMKMWKRRSAGRKARAMAFRAVQRA